MKYLFFDTETNGLPKKWGLNWNDDLQNYPRLVTISWILTDENGSVLSTKDCIIKPVGFEITEGVDVHGVSHEKALKEGIDLETVLVEFTEIIDNDNVVLVAHNLAFDFNVVFSEVYRLLKENINSSISDDLKLFDNGICTMESLKSFVGIKNYYGFKWPTLQELHYKLFSKNFDNAHNSLADTQALVRCFFEAKKDESARKLLNL